MNCKKVEHLGEGYLHAADDDGPYNVDGVLYCGRCHGVIDHGGFATPKPSEKDESAFDTLPDDFETGDY